MRRVTQFELQYYNYWSSLGYTNVCNILSAAALFNTTTKHFTFTYLVIGSITVDRNTLVSSSSSRVTKKFFRLKE